MKKHLFLCELYPPLIGGTCSMFSGRFEHCNPEKIIILTKKVEKSDCFDLKQKYPIFRIAMKWRGVKGFEWLGVVLDLIYASIPLIRRLRISSIECARPLPEGIAGLFLSILLRKKLIVNYHGEEISVLQNYRVERFLLKLVARKAHLNLVNSSYTKQLVKNLAEKNINIEIIYPGFSPEKLKQQSDKKVFANTERQIILTVGRLQKRKGQDNVVKAMAKVVEVFPKAHYFIVGSPQGGNEAFRDEVRQLIKEHQLESHVTIVGEVDDETMVSYYQNCDVFIMANRKENNDVEGFGIVFLEAAYFEKPVIGGKIGGSVDALEDGKTGYLVDGENIDEIADKIIKLLQDEEMKTTFGKAGKQFCLQLTHKKLSSQYQKISQKIL